MPSRAARLRTTSCDLAAGKVCRAAYANGYRLSAGFYHGDRAMRESGFDTSFRFGPFSGSTQDYAPVCLNALLFKYATDLAYFAHELGNTQDEQRWTRAAQERKAAIDRYLWHADAGLYYDYDYVTKQASTYNFVSTFYPLWAGAASPAQAAAVDKHLALFEHAGGVAMSDRESGVQWDLPYGWAPTNWFAVAGLDREGFHADAARLARAFMKSVETNYQADGTIREKYNVVSADANVKVAAGYKANVIGFGWTNGVYTSMEALLAQPAGSQAAPHLLTSAELETIVPATVFFRGQTATVQRRNSGGARYADGMMLFAAKVDTGGYATNLQERYQDYFVSEVPLHFASQTLAPGAYGVGFTTEGFLVMDLGGNTLFTVPAANDANLRRPTPLQLTQTSTGLRLASGRTYIDFSR